MPRDERAYSGSWPVIAGFWVFAVGVVLYWLSFFLGGEVHAAENDCYLIFERNFPAPDVFTAIAGLVCAEGLRRGRSWAPVWGGVAAGGILFLGFIDVSYNVWNGMYARLSVAMLMENVINLFCFTFGPYVLRYSLRQACAGAAHG
jgi:hypothetical protein